MKFIFQGSQKKHVRVAISQKALSRISWYAPHFKGFWIPFKMHLIICLETDCTSPRTLCVRTRTYVKKNATKRYVLSLIQRKEPEGPRNVREGQHGVRVPVQPSGKGVGCARRRQHRPHPASAVHPLLPLLNRTGKYMKMCFNVLPFLGQLFHTLVDQF